MNGKTKIMIAFGVSVFAGVGYLGYRHIKKRGLSQYIIKNLQLDTPEDDVEGQNGLLDFEKVLKATSLEFIQSVKKYMELKRGHASVDDLNAAKEKIESEKDYEKQEVKRALGLHMFN